MDGGLTVLWGRDDELRVVRRLVAGAGDAEAGMTGLVIVGEPGIGKSSLWTRGVRDAAGAGTTVLATTCVQAESEMPHAGLEDLLGSLLDARGDLLPPPQRDALDGAFRRVHTAAPTDPRTVAASVATLLRHALDGGPVVVAVDDLHWMDRETHTCLAYAARRLADHPLVLLLTAREPSPLWHPPRSLDTALRGVVEGLAPDRKAIVRLGPLGGGAIRGMLRERLRIAVSADEGRRIATETGGNPFWALEFGRHERVGRAGVEPAPGLAALVSDRLVGLDPAVVEAASLVAALGRPAPTTVLGALAGGGGRHGEALLDAAIDAGLLALVEGRLTPSHPLIGAALLAHLPLFGRRRIYRQAAELVESGEARALHLLRADAETDLDATDDPAHRREEQHRLLVALDEACLAARHRGAASTAAGFAARALAVAEDRVEPGGAPSDHDLATRLVVLAELHHQAGEPEAALAALERVALGVLDQDVLERGAPLLAQMTNDRHGETAARAVVDAVDGLARAGLSGTDLVRRRALVSTLRADTQCGAVGDRRAAARRAVADTGRASVPAPLRRRALGALAYALLDVGEPVGELLERLESLGPPGPAEPRSGADVDLTHGMTLWYEMDLAGARRVFASAVDRHMVTGDEHALASTGDMLAYVEILAGLPGAAESTLDRLDQVLDRRRLPNRVDARGVLHLVRGEHEAVDELLDRRATARSARSLGFSARLRGLLALQRGDPERGVAFLEEFTQLAEHAGVSDPHRRLDTDAFLADALIVLGEHDRAEKVISRLGSSPRAAERPVTQGQQHRLRALLAAHRDADLDTASARARTAVALTENGPVPAEHGRGLLTLAGIHDLRGEYHHAAALRRRAHDLFLRIGHLWWAGRAVESGAEGSLTRSERAVADLVAAGASNRDTAAALHLSVRTVENHLRRIYRKLGIRSRAELAPPTGPPHDGSR